ncbi:hypothetical protein FAIPA1_10561 [Frankia sp. AiPs1]
MTETDTTRQGGAGEFVLTESRDRYTPQPAARQDPLPRSPWGQTRHECPHSNLFGS